MNDVSSYCRILAEQLRINGVRERTVREVVAQVQEHTAATREDPLEAFGQPAEYARQWLVPTRGRLIRGILGGVAGVTSLLALFSGISVSGPWTAQVDVQASLAILWLAYIVTMAVFPWTLELWLARRRARRYGASLGVPDWAIRTAVFGLYMAAVWTALFVWPGPEADVAFSAPKWVLVAVGVACLPGLPFLGTGQRRALPEPPGPVSWKTRVRRAFINR